MKPQEFRIGNLIKWNDESNNIVYIDAIEKEDGGEYYIRYYEFDCKESNGCALLGEFDPIPLTEEWLIKFGWVWNDECNSYEKYPNGDIRMNLSFQKINNSYTMFNYVLQVITTNNIWYIHQLQNLYFALTGNELNIKINDESLV